MGQYIPLTAKEAVEGRTWQNPKEFVLWQNYPNPFNAETILKYQLPSESNVSLSIFNLLGQQIASLVDKKHVTLFYLICLNNLLHAQEITTQYGFHENGFKNRSFKMRNGSTIKEDEQAN